MKNTLEFLKDIDNEKLPDNLLFYIGAPADQIKRIFDNPDYSKPIDRSYSLIGGEKDKKYVLLIYDTVNPHGYVLSIQDTFFEKDAIKKTSGFEPETRIKLSQKEMHILDQKASRAHHTKFILERLVEMGIRHILVNCSYPVLSSDEHLYASYVPFSHEDKEIA